MITTIKRLLILLVLPTQLFAHDQNSVKTEGQTQFPSHCHSSENVYLNAKMQKVINSPSSGALYELKPTGKILSLCYSKLHDTTPMIVYRYGKIGDVEFEKVATIDAPFSSYHRIDGRLGNEVIFFNNGNINYYISRALGMGSGISIDVFRKEKRLAKLHSGLDRELDYNAEDYVDILPSEVLIESTPRDESMRSPNRISWIKREYKDVRNNLNDYKRKSIKLAKSTEGGEAITYKTEWGDIRLINLTHLGETGKRSYQIYYQGNKAFFVLEQDYSYNAPITMTPERAARLSKEEETKYEAFDPNKSTVKEWRYYFDGDYTVKVLGPNKKTESSLEKSNGIIKMSRESLELFLEKS